MGASNQERLRTTIINPGKRPTQNMQLSPFSVAKRDCRRGKWSSAPKPQSTDVMRVGVGAWNRPVFRSYVFAWDAVAFKSDLIPWQCSYLASIRAPKSDRTSPWVESRVIELCDVLYGII